MVSIWSHSEIIPFISFFTWAILILFFFKVFIILIYILTNKKNKDFKEEENQDSPGKKRYERDYLRVAPDRYHRSKLKIYQSLSLFCDRSLIQALLPESLSEGY